MFYSSFQSFFSASAAEQLPAPINATFLVAHVTETNAGYDVVHHAEVAYLLLVHRDASKVK